MPLSQWQPLPALPATPLPAALCSSLPVCGGQQGASSPTSAPQLPAPQHCCQLPACACRLSAQLRARVWPLLLGVPGPCFSQEDYEQLADSEHKDSAVVECDVARSLWSLTQGLTNAALLHTL